MLYSMTGFGRGSAHRNGTSVTAEIRSVNNRFIEVAVRLPRALAHREADVQNRLKHAFARGRISVQLQVEQSAEVLPVRVDAAAARAYRALLEELAAAAGLDEAVHLDHLLRFAEVFKPADDPQPGEDDASLWAVAEAALDEAIADLREQRRQEGEALAADLLARTDTLEALLTQVERRAPQRIAEARARLQARLAELLGEVRLDPERLEQEIALLADRLDVTEETVRLRSHLQLFREALAASKPVGSRMNFLTQEINREVNTIGSKANDTEVAHLAVGMKDELEKIREQVQNVE